MNTKQTTAVALRAKNWRFNPLNNLQPASLTRHLNAFEAGYLRDVANIWEALEQRDDLLRTVISKRKKSVARHGWTVLPKENLADSEKEVAEQQVAALNFFYMHLECEHSVDTSERGGFKLLTRQMMDAVGKRFAVHEIIWKECPQATASDSSSATHRNFPNFVSAKFRFVPLAFFENTTGKLRFLESDTAIEGRPLEPGAWMVTVGEGLMIASSNAWMTKNIALNDWLKCSQRNGTPAIVGTSSAVRDSAEWNAFQEALLGVTEGGSMVHSSTEAVDVLNLMGGSTLPFPALVERIDRMLAALWRGADLSTMSRDRGYGASLQEKETCALEEDDAEMLTETLHRYVDAWVIRHVFGESARPLASIKILVSPRECTTGDLQIDEFLIRHGAPLAIEETLHRYGRALPKAGEPVFVATVNSQHKASRPESSQKLGMAMDNEGFGCGPSVSFRGCSPEISTEGHEGKEEQTPHVVSYNGEGASLENQFTVLQEEWVQLSPYGDYPHARGIQRIDRAGVDTLVAQFSSFRARLGRLFGGVPFYVGHPDLPNSSELVDRKAYGWINEIEAREDGLYGRVKWSDAGMELLRNAHFKFLSPYWEAREIGKENGRAVYQPIALISAGLTNQPNIPVRPLANEVGSFTEGNEGNEAAENRGLGDHVPPVLGAPLAAEEGLLTSSPTRTEEAAQVSLLTSAATTKELENVRASRRMHTASCTEHLGLRRSELVRLQNRRDRIQEAVLAKVRLGLTYDEAWESVKREHVSWFENAQ
ncbi:MAG TPA: DUF935 family protein [Verrucomicrobiae bacterium]